jgi:hypothetical protein
MDLGWLLGSLRIDDHESSEEVLPLYMIDCFSGIAGGPEIQPSGYLIRAALLLLTHKRGFVQCAN